MHISVHRAGLVAGALAAVVLIGSYYLADGYLSAHRAAPVASSIPAVATSSAPQPADSTAPEIVYVRPAPSPQVIHVTQTAPPSAPKVVRITVASAGGERGDGSEGGGEQDGGGD